MRDSERRGELAVEKWRQVTSKATPPGFSRPTDPPSRVPTLIGLGGILALAGVVGAILWLSLPASNQIGRPPTASPPAGSIALSPSPSVSASATNSVTPSTPLLTPSPSPADGSQSPGQWTRVQSPAVASLRSVNRIVASDGMVYGLASRCDETCTYQLISTVDGESWKSVGAITQSLGGRVADFGIGPTGMVAVGTDPQPAIWSSGDGEHWDLVDDGSLFANGSDGGPTRTVPDNPLELRMHSVVNGPLGWLAGGDLLCSDCLIQPEGVRGRYVAWLSADGTSWVRQPWHPGPTSIYSLAADATAYFAASPSDLWRSVDGETWAQGLSVDSQTTEIADIAAADGTQLAVGIQSSAIVIWRSLDGLDWEEVPAQDGFSTGFSGQLRWIGEKWYLVGLGSPQPNTPLVPMIWDSFDGLTWTAHVVTTEPGASAADVAAVGDRLVVVGSVGDGGPSTRAAVWIGSLP